MTKSALSFFLSLLFTLALSSPVFALSYIGVDTISHSLTSKIGNTQKNTFLSDEALSLKFTLRIAQEDIGTQGNLYLLAAYNNDVYMMVQSGHWLPLNASKPLQAMTNKKLQALETITVLDNTSLPAGEYMLLAAYQTAKGDIKFNQELSTFMVADKSGTVLHRVKNAAFLNEYLNKAQSAYKEFQYAPMMADSQFTGGAQFSGATEAAAPTSQTNLQEIGVDESDTVKTSGNILFALEQCGEAAKENTDADLPKDTGFAPTPEQNKTCLSSYALQTSPAAATHLDKKILMDTNYSTGSLFLSESSAETPAEKLIWVSDTLQQNIWAFWGAPYYWMDQNTTLKFFDISNPDSLSLINSLSIEGALISSRRIGDKLYLITRKNHDAITPLEKSPLPDISFNENLPAHLVEATDCYVPGSRSDQAYDGTIITITSLSISNPDNHHSSCIVGNIETAYVSTQAIYLATSRYPYSSVNNTILYDQAAEYTTEIHQFNFTDEHVDYAASGTVPGHLGWEMDKKPFRMGEYNGILKVATSLGNTWGMSSRTRVGVLRENSAGTALEEISFIDNLGKPGEKLYAARFIGNRGYLVTFRTTDPLYMLDFTVPESPQLLGELEIDGYSDYLHPIGENFLLGIGKDAVPDEGSSDFGGRGAWYQGVKLSLFDVSEGDKLREIKSIVIGKRGTSSAVLSDHHALAWLPGVSENNFRLAIPVNEHTTGNEWNDYSHPSAYYNWTQTGAYVFEINTGSNPGLSLTDKIITESLENNDSQPYSNGTERIILQGDALHFVHDNTVYSATVD